MWRWRDMTPLELAELQRRAQRRHANAQTARAVRGWALALLVGLAFWTAMASLYWHAWPWSW